MNKRMLFAFMVVGMAAISSAGAGVPVPVAQDFALQDVRLLPGRFKEMQDLEGKYILSLEPDRLLAGFRANAGLPEKAKAYGGWESRGISGQTAGHYLTACALMWAATGQEVYRERIASMVGEMAACQAASADGFLGGMPRGVAMFDEIKAGDVRPKGGFDLNGGWVPWYNQHKVFAGLRDAWLLAGNELARGVYVRMGDWAIGVCAKLDDATMQRMLSVEQGGMLEVLADLYAITGEEKYLNLARRFWHEAVMNPLADGEDRLTGLHANTNIPKVIGAARMYELTGEEKYRNVAETFWKTVAQDRSFVTGSNSDREHFFARGLEARKLGVQNGETCNVYNMLKLSGHLAGWTPSAKVWDFYERAMFNHILGSIDPDSGMVTYFQALKPGHFKVYGTREDSFWCCTGTGLENHAKYGEHVYSKASDGSAIYVNLFVASEVKWKEKGLVLRQETVFPYEGKSLVRMKLEKPARFAVKVRVPGWTDGKMTLSTRSSANAKDADLTTAKAGEDFIMLEQEWKDGDTIEVTLPMSLKLHRSVDDPTMVAAMYGPVVLAGVLGTEGMPKDIQADQTSQDHVADPGVPVMVTGNTDDVGGWLRPMKGNELLFETVDVGRPSDMKFKPIADVHHERFAAYFRAMDANQYAAMQAQLEAERKAAADLDARTVDEVVFGEQQPEKDHAAKVSEGSRTGRNEGRPWRDASNGGWFSAQMTVKPGIPQALRCTYWGSDTGGRAFEILVDGQPIATQQLKGEKPGEFFHVEYPIPAALLEGKKSVEVRFQGLPGQIVGGLFGCRVLLAR